MSTAQAAHLTQAYRQAQAVLAARSAAGLTVAYNTLLDPSNLDRSFDRYSTVARQVINAARAQAAGTAGAYYTAHRDALGVKGALHVAYADDIAPARAVTSLLVTGPVRVRQSLGRGSTLEAAMRAGLSATLGAGYRMAADGGRETLRDTVMRDPRALGWQRVPDGDPCAFCAMLAGRGAVYKSEDSAGADGYHDRCGCMPEPVYSDAQPTPAGADRFAGMWADSGAETLSDFRSYYAANR